MFFGKFFSNCISLENWVGDENICNVLPDLVPFVQFKKHEEHPWWSATFSKVAG